MNRQAEALMICSGAVVVLAYMLRKRRMQKRKKRLWCRERKRESVMFMPPVSDTQNSDKQYIYFPGMSISVYEELFEKIGPKISKQATIMRNPIPVADRMAAGLKFLSSGESYRNLEQHFGFSTQSIGGIVMAFCNALIEALSDNVKLPSNASDWMEICDGFEGFGGLPHCVGAVQVSCINLHAAVHVSRTPSKKRYQSRLILLTIVDANSNIMYANVIHDEDRPESDTLGTNISTILSSIISNLPEPKELPGSEVAMPYFFASENAFSDCDNILTPYSTSKAVDEKQEYFNKRLERCYKASDVTLEKMCSVFKFLQMPLRMDPLKGEVLVKSAIHLHNHLKVHSNKLYMSAEGSAECLTAESGEKMSMAPLKNISVEPTLFAALMRDEISDYCYKNDAALREDDLMPDDDA